MSRENGDPKESPCIKCGKPTTFSSRIKGGSICFGCWLAVSGPGSSEEGRD